jgi:hypothetical protein
MKKIDPNTESFMWKTEYLYSINCKYVNIPARAKVQNSPFITCPLLPAISAACAHVKVIPDVSKRKVFIEAITQGVGGITPLGGQIPPIQIDGDKL